MKLRIILFFETRVGTFFISVSEDGRFHPVFDNESLGMVATTLQLRPPPTWPVAIHFPQTGLATLQFWVSLSLSMSGIGYNLNDILIRYICPKAPLYQ